MADEKISQMPAATTPLGGGETVAGLQSGGNVQITASSIAALAATSFANPTATAGPNAVNGVATTAMRSDAAPMIQLASASVPGIVQGDGSTLTINGSGVASVTNPAPLAANPSATAGPNAVNGVATTFMRSDAAPKIQLGSSAQLGLLQNDGVTILDNGSGVIHVPPGSGSTAGVIQIDNTTIKINAGKAGVSTIVPWHPGYRSGRWYTCPLVNGPSTVAMAANTLYAVPFYVGPPTTFTQVGVNVTVTSNGNHLEMGIYNNNNGIPGTLFSDCGTFAMTAAAGFKTITGLNLAMQGWYWLVVASDSTPTVSTTGALATLETLFGYDSSNFAITAPGITGAWTFSAGNLPATFPTVTYANSATPLLWIGP